MSSEPLKVTGVWTRTGMSGSVQTLMWTDVHSLVSIWQESFTPSIGRGVNEPWNWPLIKLEPDIIALLSKSVPGYICFDPLFTRFFLLLRVSRLELSFCWLHKVQMPGLGDTGERFNSQTMWSVWLGHPVPANRFRKDTILETSALWTDKAFE